MRYASRRAHATRCNPYEKATTGLEQLSELAELQEKQKQALDAMDQTYRDLRSDLTTLLKYLASKNEQGSIVGNYLAALPETVSGVGWTSIYEADANPEQGLPTVEDIFEVARRIEEQDNALKLSLDERQNNITERDRLNEYQLLVQAQDIKRQTSISAISTARRRIEVFEEENATLIKEAAQETTDSAHDTPIKIAYDHFLLLLRQYRDELPATLIAGLNDRAMTLYNEFNRNDLDADKLSALHLPLTSEQKIELSFRSNL